MSEKSAKQFSIYWKNRGNEKSDTQIFWLTMLRDVFEIERPERLIYFEQPVQIDGHTHFIDALIPSTRVLIEQKSLNVDLYKPSVQSDGKILTPFEQAQRYADELPYSQRPRYIVTCNFAEFRIYDLDWHENYKRYQNYYLYENLRKYVQFIGSRDDTTGTFTPEIIKLERLSREYENLQFFVNPDFDKFKPDIKISKAAVDIVSDIYDAFDDNNQIDNDSLNKLCVRLVFCMYAEDAGLFDKNQLYDYLKNYDEEKRHNALENLFNDLNRNETNKYNFPYVNGGLFADQIEVPKFNDKINYILLSSATLEFDWSGINPTIFGALFEATLNPLTRRTGGMHYTSIENIHKVIDPLFMDDLHEEFKRIKRSRINKVQRLRDFQNKLASLKFLDPACGSGNFLTETYLSLRRLENDVIREINNGNTILENPVKVSINQFFGIEINSYAVAVAQTALWIAESQMLQDTELIINRDLQFLPLKTSATIVKANALRIDWHDVVSLVDYVIGNPPFVGYSFQTDTQKADLLKSTGLKTKKIDYVVSWYYKAAQFIQNTNIRCAFVSTNSICQGEQVAVVWKPLFDKYGIHIDFAYRTFKWTSESENVAAVHCVIIGFSQTKNHKPKMIYEDDKCSTAQNINAYLVDSENIFVESRNTPLCDVPIMMKGNQPTDGGNLIIEADDYDYFVNYEPESLKYIRPLLGAEEFLKDKKRYCLWLVSAIQDDIDNMPLVKKRVEAVRQFRLKSKKAITREDAKTPHLFQEIRQPNSDYIIIPHISSGTRKYIPIGFVEKKIIATNLLQIIPNAKIYHFGILTSNVHMSWMRYVCGRFGAGYTYSNKIVYNNFVWCKPNWKQKRAIEQTAEDILIARSKYPNWSLAKLYDEKTMPAKLRKAHEANDEAVMNLYGFDMKMTEIEIVAELMNMYKKIRFDKTAEP